MTELWPQAQSGSEQTFTDLEPLRIAVTGASSGIGACIVAALDEPEIKGAFARLGGRLMIDKVSRTHGMDLTKHAPPRLLQQTRPDIVIHAAATPYHVAKNPECSLDTLQDDVLCTLGALRACTPRDGDPKREHPPHFVLLSSMLVYEHASKVRPLAESDTEHAPPPTSPIGLAKLMSERAVKAWSKQTGGTYTIWRLANVVSPWEQHAVDGHLIPNLFRQLFVELRAEVRISNVQRAHTWIGDVVEGVLKLCGDPRVLNQTFNMGGSELRSMHEIASEMIACAREVGGLPLPRSPDLPVLAFNSAEPADIVNMSSSKLKTMTGWAPGTTFRAMIRNFMVAKATQAAQR